MIHSIIINRDSHFDIIGKVTHEDFSDFVNRVNNKLNELTDTSVNDAFTNEIISISYLSAYMVVIVYKEVEIKEREEM